MALPTAPEIRAITLKAVKGTALDADITRVIGAADGMLARYCLFPVSPGSTAEPSLDKDAAASTYTLYYNGPWRRDPRILPLNLRPIVSITSVTQDSNGDWTYAQTEAAGTDYVLDNNGRLYLHPSSSHAWFTSLRSIKVVCVAGFDVANHAPTREALAILVSYLWNNGYQTQGIQTTTSGAQSTTYREAVSLPASVRQIMEPYRLVEREASRE